MELQTVSHLFLKAKDYVFYFLASDLIETAKITFLALEEFLPVKKGPTLVISE